MNVVVVPSLWEGLPIALLESMALGRTVVATNVGGVPEVIEDQGNGLLAPPQNAPALAEAVYRCWRHPDLADSLAAAAARTIAGGYSIQDNARRTLAVYRQMTARQ